MYDVRGLTELAQVEFCDLAWMGVGYVSKCLSMRVVEVDESSDDPTSTCLGVVRSSLVVMR